MRDKVWSTMGGIKGTHIDTRCNPVFGRQVLKDDGRGKAKLNEKGYAKLLHQYIAGYG